MKPDSNMETDRLLHQLARRSRGSFELGTAPLQVAADDATDKDVTAAGHLDADELIAFAENALPAEARTRYMGHLAECDPCRKLVTDLALSSGIDTRREPLVAAQLQTSTRSWRDWLKPMFAPTVLRYAAPIVLLVGISAIALMIYRDRNLRFETSSTRPMNGSANEKAPESAASKGSETGKVESSDKVSQPEGKSNSKTGTDDQGPGASEAPQDGTVAGLKSGQDQPAVNQPAPVTSGALADEESSARDKDSKAGLRQQPTLSEDAVAKTESQKEIDQEKSQGRVASEMDSRDKVGKQKNDGGANVADSETSSPSSAKSVARKRSKTDADPQPSAIATQNARDDRKGQGAGTGASEGSRTVNGKQFVRRNGAWVDVAFTSQGTTGVRRGSDQYRALVADEPGLRAFASQLDGEVIVVWKGRAYRFY